MLGKKENAILTQTGPNTPMGDLFRHYWMPVLLSEELSEIDGAPVKIYSTWRSAPGVQG